VASSGYRTDQAGKRRSWGFDSLRSRGGPGDCFRSRRPSRRLPSAARHGGIGPGHLRAEPDVKRRPRRARVLGAIGFGMVAVSVVFLARAVLSLPTMQDFLTRFPGEYVTPAVPGIAPWVGWQHFFNMFLMVLIIRSGLGVRHEKRPEAYWTSRNGKTKISLTLWLHQSLDILWLANGVVFLVLLFLTGRWAWLIPTSWEVFPNALSAALQYISLEWPVENGWNNYNSLQQLAYFVTVFLAAPLSAISGFRMSGLWPKRAERLSKAYRVECARAIHYPVMLYFIAFIVVHVALVMLTGFLRNLNHMYASEDTNGWLGFWIFLGSIVMIAAGWILARTSLLSPVAGLFGKVSSR
jgi:thiosulfate reductase cytochrome b subunit